MAGVVKSPNLPKQELYRRWGTRYKTTNNEMEMMAITEALGLIHGSIRDIRESDHEIISDSELAIKWIQGVDTVNADHLKSLFKISRHHLKSIDPVTVQFSHTPAHVGHPINEAVDKLARGKATKLKDNLRKLEGIDA